MEILPLKKDKGEVEELTAELESGVFHNLSAAGDPGILRLKTWTVPLSLETASHWAVEENAKL